MVALLQVFGVLSKEKSLQNQPEEHNLVQLTCQFSANDLVSTDILLFKSDDQTKLQQE